MLTSSNSTESNAPTAENSSKLFKKDIRVTVYITCGSVYSQVLHFDIDPTDEDLMAIADVAQIANCGFGNDDGWQVIHRGTNAIDVIKR